MAGQRVRTTESKAPAVLAGLVVALLAAGGVALVLGDGLTGDSRATSSVKEKCSNITLNAPASIVDPVAEAVDAVAAELGCDSVAVSSETPAWGQKPKADLWIAESSVLVAAAVVEPIVDSLASTPVVTTVAPGSQGWSQQFATATQVTQRPLEHLPSALALLAAKSESDAEAFADLVLSAAQGTTDDGAKDVVTVTTEQARRTAGKRMWVPETTAFLDFPLVQLRDEAEVAQVARAIADWFGTEPGKQALAQVNLRGPDRAPLDIDSAQANAVALAAETSQAMTELDARWQEVHRPLNTLLVLDASGSMRQTVAGEPRAALATDTLSPLLDKLASPSRVGLWTFAVRPTSPAGQFWQELAPVQELRTAISGQTQRVALQQQLQAYRTDLEGGTGLFDTTLAAYRSAVTNYRPGHRNVVVLVSDGSNDDTDSLALDTLVDELTTLRDKERPVQMVGVSVAPDGSASTLREMVAATGGTVLTVAPGGDITQALYRALVAGEAGDGNG